MKPKYQRKTKTPNLVFWCKGSETGLNIPSQLNRIKFAEFNKKNKDKWFRTECYEADKPKSEELLGFLWGGLYPLYLLHTRHPEIKWKDEPFFVRDCYKQKLLTTEEIEEVHAMFMTEYEPQMVFNLRTG